MPKPKGKNSEMRRATHARVLEAARDLFGAFGYEAVSTQQIAAAARVAEGSVFHHFGSKKELFIQVHNLWQANLVDRIATQAARAKSPSKRFEKIWQTYLESTRDPHMRRVLLLDGPKVIGLEALRAQDRKTAFAFFQTELEKVMLKGAKTPPDGRALAVVLFGALDQAAFELADFPGDETLRRALVRAFQALVAPFLEKGERHVG